MVSDNVPTTVHMHIWQIYIFEKENTTFCFFLCKMIIARGKYSLVVSILTLREYVMQTGDCTMLKAFFKTSSESKIKIIINFEHLLLTAPEILGIMGENFT